LPAYRVTSLADIESLTLDDGIGELIEILLPQETYVFPKLEFGKPNQDQEPLLDRKLYEDLMAL
jgi:acetolactate synthase-1/2/3 large subunit